MSYAFRRAAEPIETSSVHRSLIGLDVVGITASTATPDLTSDV